MAERTNAAALKAAGRKARGFESLPFREGIRRTSRIAIGRSARYELIWNGELTSLRIGRSVRFTVTELQRFVASRAETI